MTNKIVWALFMSIAICFQSYAQSPPLVIKNLKAQRLTGTIKIDGKLDDPAWKDAPLATHFIENRPAAGKAEAYTSRTEVFILYDNTSIYIGGHCYEQTPDSISRELAGRDQIGANDFVGVIFDTYHDKINASGFFVTPLGEQYDAKYSNTGNNGGEDASWDAVWYSEAQIVKDGWTFEMRIPYSALRFSSKGKTWGLNIVRRRKKTGEQYMWNPVLPTVNGFINQEGIWDGVTDIKPPVRLSFSPYFSTYVNHYPYNIKGVKNTTASVNGGMDVKYGINQNYTLDMTLIPDFGQVQSDKKVLNLTPFEVKYAENRPFFTEGTELFNKGNLFYSRRVGGEPLHKNDVALNSNEIVIDNPTESKLINATKISGRNQKGLGIGFFNAVSQAMYAEVEDTISHQKRSVQTGALTNYNIFVLDQTLKNNSSVSLINTSVIRSGKDYDANVTAGVFDLNNKKNSYNLNGKFAVSNITSAAGNITGYSNNIGIVKTGGRLNMQLSQELTDNKYQQNDLGYFTNNDYLNHYFYVGYKWLKPNKWYNNLYFNLNNNLSHRFSDGAFQSLNINSNVNGTLRNLWDVGLSAHHDTKGNDFYEPRKAGRVFKTPSANGAEIWLNSNQAKKYSGGIDLSLDFLQQFSGKSRFTNFYHKYRFNNKFSLSQNITYSTSVNIAGFADIDAVTNEIIFGSRKRNTVDNSLSIKYSFSKNSSINFTARHYWSQVNYRQYYTLNNDGTLAANNTYNGNKDYSVNLFNIDMVYTWQFAPGSFVNIVWKNAIVPDDLSVQRGYFKNLDNTLKTSQNNNVSIKILYYLDYLSLKKKK
ncbi:MAG: DUF5916 domain-containing protein [Ferruginibacter sp.]